MTTYNKFLNSLPQNHNRDTAIDFAEYFGFNARVLQPVADSMWFIQNGSDTNITIYVDKDGSVYLTVYSKDCNILDRAHLRKRKDDWVEIEE